MASTLYLLETRARNEYICPGCQRKIARGELHFRHDPHPYARIYQGQPITHWCRDCILASNPGPKDSVTQRLRVPIVQITSQISPFTQLELPLFTPVKVELVGVSTILLNQLAEDPFLLYQVSPATFEEFICDRLFAMGFEPRRVGETNRKDGGVDVLFWPRLKDAFPFLGAAQVKHHRDPNIKERPATVREFAGTISTHPFNAGILITNTSFTPDAEWFAREHAKLLRLRDFSDIRRWLLNNFSDEAEWREIPATIELCPGITIKIR